MRRKIIIAMCLALALATTAVSAKLMVYPAKGQSAEQQKTDEGACMSWGSQQTGFDPTQPMQLTPPPPTQQPTSNAAKGALRGALGGLIVGAIAGDAGKGAAIGAGTGLLLGGVRHHEQVQSSYAQQDAWAQQQAAKYQQSQDDFNRAYATCLQGRGYTVN